MDGFLDLTNLDAMDDDDILNANINESGDVNISVPDGLSERPSGVPSDVNISIPGSTQLTDKQYKDALGALQKSFKEGYEIMQMLQEASIVTKSVEELQEEFTENAIMEAVLASYEDGPMFESVTRKDKKEVKAIVRKIRKNIKNDLASSKIKMGEPNYVLKVILSAAGIAIAASASAALGISGLTTNVASAVSFAWTNELKIRLWQSIGTINIEEGNIKDITDALNKKYANDLGDYKVLAVKVVPSIADIIANHFGWKNSKKTYFLTVDAKVDTEWDKIQEEAVKAINENKKDEKSKKDDKEEKEV